MTQGDEVVLNVLLLDGVDAPTKVSEIPAKLHIDAGCGTASMYVGTVPLRNGGRRMAKPRIGLIVHYVNAVYENNQRTDKSKCVPGILTALHEDGKASMNLFTGGKIAAANEKCQDEDGKARDTWHSLDSCEH